MKKVKKVTYMYMDQLKIYSGVADDMIDALRICKEMGALEVFILKGDVDKIVNEVGLKKVYNLVRISHKYNLSYVNTLK